MKNASTTQTTNGITYILPAINPDKPHFMDLVDVLDRKAAQLDALLCISLTEDFSEHSDKLKMNYLWICQELAQDIRNGLNDQWQAYKKLHPTPTPLLLMRC